MSQPHNNTITHTSGFDVVRRIAVNMTSLLTTDVLTRATTFIVYVLVARYCGPHSFGQLSLGLMFLYTFQVFATAGLPVLITREVSKDLASSGRYLTGAGVIVCGAFVVSLASLGLLVYLSGYPADTSRIILLLAFGILPWSLTTIINAILQAWERMQYIMLIALPVNAAKIGLSYYMLSAGHDVEGVALVFLGCHFATLLLQLPIVFRHVHLRDMAIDWLFCKDLLRRTWRFLGIEGMVAVWGSTNTLLLSWFWGETAVGLFAAAWQLLVPVSMTFQAVVNSFFPILCRRAVDHPERFRRLTVLTLELLMIVAVPGCILLYFGADAIIALIYSDKDFSGSAVILRIFVPMLLLQALCVTLGQVLYSQGRENFTLRIVTVDVLFNAACGAVLVYNYGPVGAAVTVLFTWIVNACLHIAATREWLFGGTDHQIAWHTSLVGYALAAGAVMAAALAMTGHSHFFVSSIATSILYVVILAGLVLLACRGPLGLRERFLVPLKET